MNKFLSPAGDIRLIRNYAFKSDLKIKWVRPEKIPCFKPEKSGDLSPMDNSDKKQYLLEFRNSKELETADEYVKRLFTLEFNRNKHTQKSYLNDMIEKVKRHEHDFTSIEVKLARWTGYIRAWQDLMERFPYDKRLKTNLKELIDRRNKNFRYLRKWDYKKFEWLLEQLNVVYKSPVPFEKSKWITRKDSLTKLTQKYCDDVRQGKLDVLRLKLENEQPAFLEEKIRSLEFIRDEQKQCGVQVTITQKELDDIKKQLEEIKLRRVETDEN